MYKSEHDTVKLSNLRPCPVKVTLQTEKMFRDLVAAARAHPERIGPISVAVLGDLQYVVDGHLRARALVEAGRASVRAHIIYAKEIADVARLHLELNTHGTINPLGMLDAVEFLKGHGAEKFVPKSYLELSEKTIHPKVRERITSFLHEACKRYSTVSLPPHVVLWIAGFEKEKDQATAAAVIIDSLRNVKEHRFVFPTPTDLEVISSQLRPKTAKEKEAIVYEHAGGAKKASPSISRKEAEGLIRGSPHDSMVHCSCGKKLLLDSRTCRVSSVKDDRENRCIKLEEEKDARPVFAIPVAMLDFLGVEPRTRLQLIKIGSKKDLESFASSIRDDARLRMLLVLPR